MSSKKRIIIKEHQVYELSMILRSKDIPFEDYQEIKISVVYKKGTRRKIKSMRACLHKGCSDGCCSPYWEVYKPVT